MVSVKVPGRVACLCCVALLLAGSEASACDVPVFRFALERWPVDPFVVTVLHSGALTADEQTILVLLRKAPGLTVETVDVVRQPDKAPPNAELPRVVLRYPASNRIEQDVWSGPLRNETVQAVLDSPARQELAKRLLNGDSAVWLLLESGQREKDDAAARVLEQQLHTLQETLEPAEPAEPLNSVEVQPAAVPQRLVFSMLRVARNDEAEAVLLQMLLHSEPDLAGRAEPMVFPIFGRGRILYALIGKGINAGTIRAASGFLTGACSCKIKQECPGVDLLLSLDWDARLQTGAGTKDAVPAPTEAVAEKEKPESTSDGAPMGMLSGILGLLVVVTGSVVWWQTKRGPHAAWRKHRQAACG